MPVKTNLKAGQTSVTLTAFSATQVTTINLARIAISIPAPAENGENGG